MVGVVEVATTTRHRHHSDGGDARQVGADCCRQPHQLVGVGEGWRIGGR